MPLDPSIFLQGAALAQKDREMLLNSIKEGLSNNIEMQKLGVEREKSKLAGFDLEKLAQGYQIKQNLGVEASPEEKAAFDTFLQFQSSERAVDPVTGNLYPKFQWSGQTGLNLNAFGPQGQGSNPAISQPYDQITPMPIDLAQVEKLTQGQPANVSGVVPGAPGLNLEIMRPRNPKAEQASIESDINASSAGAETYAKTIAENAAERENTLVSLDTVLSSLNDLEKIIGATPSGGLQASAAKIGNFFGRPNPQALAQADVDAAMPTILSNVKTVIRQKGEGTFSDADQKLLDRMLPLDSDSTPVKIRKLVAVRKEFERLKNIRSNASGAYKEKNSQNPGFRYIGRKQ